MGPNREDPSTRELADPPDGTDASQRARMDSIWDSMFDLPMLRRLLSARGLYPDDVPGLIRYAALGLTSMCWRNTVLENWHAGAGPLSDADMMVENAKTSLMARHALVAGLDPKGEGWLLTSADTLTAMAQVAGDELDELIEHAHGQVGALIDKIAEGEPVSS